MSAQLAGDGTAVARSNVFSAYLALAAGVTVNIHAPTLNDLQLVVTRLSPAANDITPGGVAGNVAAAATAPAGTPASQTAAVSAQPAAAAAAGEAGNASGSTTSSSEPSASPAVTFPELKTAFLALSTKPGGREKCEAVLAPFKLAKLSAATEAQYPAVLEAINQASK